MGSDTRLIGTALPMLASIIAARLIDAMFGAAVSYVAVILLLMTIVVWTYGSEVVFWILHWRTGSAGGCDGDRWNAELRYVIPIVTMVLVYALCSVIVLLITRDWAIGNLNPWESAMYLVSVAMVAGDVVALYIAP